MEGDRYMKTYHASKRNNLVFYSISTKVFILAALALSLFMVPMLLRHSIANIYLISPLTPVLDKLSIVLVVIGAALFVLAAIIQMLTPQRFHIVRMVRRGLFDPARGNPLHLREGELLPNIRCKCAGEGLYDLSISAQQGVTVETIKGAAPSISAALNRRFQRYAVVAIDQDTAFNWVTFRLDDVKVDRSLVFKNVEQMRPSSPTLLQVDKTTNIDLTSSGSMLFAGKTRSGKTTGVINIIIQVLLCGSDKYGSKITIIDPKQAELSRLPYVVTLDKDGETRSILFALKDYADTITQRQRVLNDLSEQIGNAAKWWEAGFRPSFLFIDEFVALRSLFPKKAEKNSDYCLDTFDLLLKRIVTMGASAGCFAIISIAEASVQEGGLPAMLRSAMSTRVLFRPTMGEGKLLWDADKLSSLPSRVYGPGDAWFSSTDGIHDAVSYVRFPRMEFPIYQELGRLLGQYYENN